MHRRKEFLIGSLIGLCIMLLALLAAVVAPRPRAALAQDTPSASISLGEFSVRQGDGTMLAATLKNLPNDPENSGSFPAYTYRFDLERKVGEEWENADNCELSPVGQTKNIHPVYDAWKVIVYSNNGLSIPASCPIGTYRVKFVLKDEHNAELVSDKREFTVLLGPSVTIEMPSGPHYRGSSIDAIIKFHELIQGASYTYEAYVMNDNPNYADNCEGTGLARNEIFSLGSVDENPEVRTGTITSSCPKENYYVTVRLFNAENRIKATNSKVFTITTNPAAIPSVSVAMSEASPVTPGTEFDVIFNFYDLQDDTAIRYLDTLTNTGTNQPVGGMDCGGSLVGWGQDVSATVIRNPIVNRVTITSDCPEGSYRLKSAIQDNSGNEIISGSIDFDIGDPDLTPTAPSVLNYPAKQNSHFSEQLPLGSGGDGTLSYGATGMPVGLNFNISTRTIAGTPTGHGTSTVTYTVTDSDGDSDSVDFTITVAPDLTPTAPSVSNLTATQNAPFSQQLPIGSGGDGTLSYAATPLPAGLSFDDLSRTIAGTPTGNGPTTVRYTVTDSDGDSAYVDFTITVAADLTPTLGAISGYTARVGSPFSEVLPAATGGDTPLGYTVDDLPVGLSFTEGTRTISGTPANVEAPTVTYTVRDHDGDEASQTFTISVVADLTPTLGAISGYTARVGSPFSEVLPAATGGDTPLGYTVDDLPVGLSFTEGTRTISGTPANVEAPTVTYTVRDHDGDEASQTFTITVVADLTPTLGAISGYTARVGSPFSEVLPAATSGDGTLSYTATPLPDGLTFDNVSRTIAGTPTTVEAPTVTYTVRDADGDEANQTFTIAVVADLTPTLNAITGYTARVNSQFSQVLPAATGGDTPLGYTVDDLPTGLSFTEATRTIAGTPTTVEAPTVTYTVRDADGDEANQTFTIAVVADLTPTLNAITGYTARVNSQFSQVLPAATGGDTPLGYTVDDLPTGLSFTEATRTIAGTPTTVEAPTVTYTVRDADGDEANQTFTIAVVADLTPTLNAITGYTARVNSQFSQVLPAATGGDTPLGYTVDDLPTGLSFTEATRTIAGTPTTVEAPTVTYTVRDADGDEANQTFTIAVVADLTPTLNAITGYTARVNSQFSQVLPAATGGDTPLGYTVDDLPTGLSFTEATRTIAGTPTTVEAPTVTYTVRDADGDEANQTFTIAVVADLTPTLNAITGYTARVNSQFSQVLPAATGGDTPLGYTVDDLPTGLSFTEATRTIAGTPTTVEAPTVTYTVRDADGDEANQTFTIAVVADLTPTLNAITGYTARVNSQFSQVLPAATGGDTPLGYTVDDLPTGLSFTEATRTIAGTPTTVEAPTVTYTVRDADGDEANQTFTIAVVADLTPTLNAITGYTARVNSQFSQVLPAATGGDTPLGYTVDDLPVGLSFTEGTRTIAGTPTTVESPTVTYTVRDDDGDEASQSFTITVEEDLKPTLTTIVGYTARVGSPFSEVMPAATGGDTPLGYTVTNMPTGLSFTESTRTIAGTPTAVQSPTVIYTVRDDDGDEATQSFTIAVSADLMPTLEAISDSSAKLTKVFTRRLPAGSGGDGNLVHAVTGLPDGLTFVQSSRTITGTPTSAKDFEVTYTATDEDNDEARQTFHIVVYALPSLSEVADIMATKDEVFTLVLTAVSGGKEPFTYTVTGLPTGLSFDKPSLTIIGTPTQIQVADVTFAVEDHDGDTDSQEFQISVSEGDTEPTFPYTILKMELRVDSPFTLRLPGATGGNAPYTYTISGLPETLSFNPDTRWISGTPTASGLHQVTFTATDRDLDPVSQTFELNIAADNMPTEPSVDDLHLKVARAFNLELPEGANGDSPYTYTVSVLPSGLVFDDKTRYISGTPDTPGMTNVTYTVTDDDGDPNSTDFKVTVYPMPSLVDVLDISFRQGDLYTVVLPEATGGRPQFVYSASPLPTGLQFITSTRTITGTPTAIETVNVTYEATDEDGDKARVTFDIDVSLDPMPEFDSVSDFNATKGSQFYALLPEASGGNTPLVYSVTGLPAGLQFITETRVITGTPTQMDVATVTYTVTDTDNDQDSVTFKITVNEPDQGVQGGNNQINNNGNGNTQNPPALTLSDSTDFSATVGDQFTQQLPAANGGTSPYLYSVTTLPAGLTFDRGTHTISGTPTEAGTKTITYRVTDNNSSQASDDFTITVSPAVLRLSDTTGFTARVGEQFTQQLPEATGGTTPYQYSVTTLPAGLTFVQETRTITGTPTLAEPKDVTYTVTDGTSNTANDAFTITVNEALSGQPGKDGGNTQSQAELTLSDTTGFVATVGELFTQQLPAASAGTPPYAYRATNLPAGLSFVELTRTITGTPTLAETKVVIYTVRDGSFSSASDAFTITVNGAQSGQPGESGNGEGNQQNPLALTLSDTAGFSATVGDLFTQQLPAASGGSSTYAYMVTDLPSGLSFVERTRTITGTPTMAETKVVTYTVADSEFSSASDTFTITVSEGQSGQQGGTGNGGKSEGSSGGGGGGGGGKSNSGNSGNSGNQQRYVPPAPSPLPSQQRSAPAPVPVAITIPYILNVRSGPGLDYEVITTVPAGTRASIYGRDPADDWFQVQIEGVDGMVWIYQELTTVEGSLDGVRFLEQWEIDLIARPGDGPLAITTPDILNVRSGPGLGYDILTTVPSGTQATIIGIGPSSEWYKVNLGVLSEPAWIYASLTTVTGSIASVKQYTTAEVDGIETGPDNPLAITVPTILNVRSGPGTEYDIVTTVAQGTQAEIIGIGPQDEWFLVELDSLDEPAWIYQDLTTVVGSLAGVRRVASWQVGQPSSDTEVERPIAVTYPSLVNVRVGPGESYSVLKAVGQGTRARIMGVGPNENWYLVDIDGLDQLGWIREDLTVLVGSLDNVKRITAEEIAMLPVAIANTALLNVRSGPDTSYGLVTTISVGTWVEVIGVNAQSDWFKVKYNDAGGQGWIYRELTYLAGPLSSVTQIASAGSPTSTQPASTQPAAPTPQPASTPQVAVGSITVDLSLPSNGTIDLEVSWTDAGACSELYRIYYRSNTVSATYFSLETAVIASTANTKSLSFQTLSDSSLISAWCGSQSTGRQVAEVQIDSNVEGTYSSTPPQPAADAVAAGPVAASRN